jgi:hypothetical protein
MGWTAQDADNFLTHLGRSAHYSIDAFLETVRDQADLGKYLMAREMKRHEDIKTLFPPSDSGWYQYLFNRLLEGGDPSGFASSCLSIITFNYDRSLEAYLHEALMARFQMSPDDASSTLLGIPIIHVHGSLGRYPDVPYMSDCETDKLLEISKQIQIIHEVSNPEYGFCNREFEQANELLNQAKRIFFLGFGFHPDNIRRFQFFTPEKTRGLEIHANTHGMGPVDVVDLTSKLKPRGINTTPFTAHRCNDFFSHVVGL